MISGSKCPKSKNLEIWNSGDPKILFLEGVISLYKFFTKSVISGSKHPKSENSKICSCLLVLSLCLLMLARQWPCPSPCSLPKIQILECVSSLHKFCTKSVISGSKCPKLKNLEIWNSGDPKLLFLEGVIFLYKFLTKLVISGSNRPKSENSKLCSCSLVLSLCLLVLSLCLLVLSSCSDHKIQFLEGVISLYTFFTKSVISGSKCPKSTILKI